MAEKDIHIRLELAKAALVGGASMARMNDMYEWVVGRESPKVDLDNVKVTDMEQYLGMSSVRFRNRCMENDIHTVGQLVRVGSGGFRALRLVGSGLVDKLRVVLSEKYGVEGW